MTETDASALLPQLKMFIYKQASFAARYSRNSHQFAHYRSCCLGAVSFLWSVTDQTDKVHLFEELNAYISEQFGAV